MKSMRIWCCLSLLWSDEVSSMFYGSTGDRKRGREEEEHMIPPPPLRHDGAMSGDRLPQRSLMPPPPSRPVMSADAQMNAEEIEGQSYRKQTIDSASIQDQGRYHPPSSSNQIENLSLGGIPKGFFEDKEADSLARGIKPKTVCEKETEFVKFQQDMESNLQELARTEAVDAEESARNREDQEGFEQQRRFDIVSSLRDKKSSNTKKIRKGGASVQQKNKIDFPEFKSDEDSESSEDGKLTDWRAKAV